VQIRAKPGDVVLDICCGSGDLSFLLSEKVGPKGKVSEILMEFGFFLQICFLLKSSH
jgi:tRNA A58 N-methylase Trm61